MIVHPSGRDKLRTTAIAVLTRANTLAKGNVFGSRTWPMQYGSGPAILVYTNNESSESKNLTSPDAYFRTTVDLTIITRVDGSLMPIEQELDTMVEQIKTALFTDASFRDLNDWFAGMHCEFDYKDGEAESMGSAVITIQCVYDELFAVNVTSDYDGANIYVDAASVATDDNGTYTPPFDYPVADPPRQGGVDGRVEVFVSAESNP